MHYKKDEFVFFISGMSKEPALAQTSDLFLFSFSFVNFFEGIWPSQKTKQNKTKQNEGICLAV
jgi:hypothetical protein